MACHRSGIPDSGRGPPAVIDVGKTKTEIQKLVLKLAAEGKEYCLYLFRD